MAEIRVRCSDVAALWRNHVGQARDAGTGYMHVFGLEPGSADLIGLRRSDGRFVAIEVKSATGRLRPNQVEWLEKVRRLGGIAGVARSVDDAREIICR